MAPRAGLIHCRYILIRRLCSALIVRARGASSRVTDSNCSWSGDLGSSHIMMTRYIGRPCPNICIMRKPLPFSVPSTGSLTVSAQTTSLKAIPGWASSPAASAKSLTLMICGFFRLRNSLIVAATIWRSSRSLSIIKTLNSILPRELIRQNSIMYLKYVNLYSRRSISVV